VSEVIRYDEALARRVQALGDTWETVKQRRRVLELLAPAPGEGILDGGCGPGHLTREIAALIGPAGRACGVDVSEQMLVLATGEDVEFTLSSGAALPYESSCFDAAVATQVYEFVEDLEAALGELHRVLRAGGRALILDTDWDTVVWHSGDEARIQRVLDGWRRRLADPHLPRTLAVSLDTAGLEVTARAVHVILDATGEAC
jgi:arsenite methyltransferase